jgi:hypothetical protein
MPRIANVYKDAQYQRRLWTPAMLLPRFWMDASVLSTIGRTSGNVSSWTSLGSGTVMTCATGPVHGTTRLNNMPVMTFNNVPFTVSASVTGGFTFACVYMKTTQGYPSVYPRLWSIDAGGNDYDNANSVLWCAGFNNNTQVLYQNGAKGTIANTTNEWYIGTATSTSLSCVNGSRASGSACSSLNATTVRIGNDRTAADSGFTGHIAENILIPRSCSVHELCLIEGYLAWKWGLQHRLIANHPFKNRPPIIGD